MNAARLEALELRTFRNVEAATLSFGPRFNVIGGENGHGKTNLLEAIYVLCTRKSFRASRVADVVSVGAESASVRGRLDGEGGVRAQSVLVRKGLVASAVDGKRPANLAAYASRSPVVAFHPAEMSITMGAGAERRKLLDRAALYVAPASLHDVVAYGRAVRGRQRSLEARGPVGRDLEAWEVLCVKHGLAVMAAREAIALELGMYAAEAFSRFGTPDLALRLRYAATAPKAEDEYLRTLASARSTDVRRRSASVGPHRDDLEIRLAGHLVRGMASQGQHRAVTLALKAAEIEVVRESRRLLPMLLLDEVSSELDRERTSALLTFLGELQGQVFLSTARPELFDGVFAADQVSFRVNRGNVSRV